jgi:hypothetical protein
MDRIKVLDDALWPTVPPEVIEEAEQSARAEPTWIVRQGNGHIVVVEEGPGSPDTATGDISHIAEVPLARLEPAIFATALRALPDGLPGSATSLHKPTVQLPP